MPSLLFAGVVLTCSLDAQENETLVPAEDLVAVGFSRSRVVMMNEAHSGLLRSKRTRLIGRLILPTAHAAGVRHFAVEALDPEFASVANRERTLPHREEGYLAQPEMRELLQAALDLGWSLIAYEAEPGEIRLRDPASAEAINWREDEQAKNLVAALAALPESAKLLVWCGNSHLMKVENKTTGGRQWLPMGKQFWSRSGIEPFTIDQNLSVDFKGDGVRPSTWVAKYGDQLKTSPVRTMGFLFEDQLLGIDAGVVSLDNELQ